MILLLLFWTSLLLLSHTYAIYPLLLLFLSRKRKENQFIYKPEDALPFISVILSVYNEAGVIEKKVRNIYATNYPANKMEVIVGSDGSDDNTNAILQSLQKEFGSLRCVIFNSRKGKANVINQLIPISAGEILVFTDAKVEFTPHTLFELVKHFKNTEIGCVGGNIINKNQQQSPLPEKAYMNLEMRNKYFEGKIWGATMGVYGACYAILRDDFVRFPENFSVEDFFITMHILKKKKKSILNKDAICFEDVPPQLSEEFRRKVRISAGNFQNLFYFKKMVWPFTSVGFCFISHKVLRWIGPILLMVLFVSNLQLFNENSFYFYSLYLQVIFLLIPLFDFFLHIIRRDILILRFISHFYSMNLALFIGLIKYLKGVKTNVWEPTKR
ncbi:MAG TPA: glycosyltransferase [Bacteroidales bacterium]|nr:glycosyltransferase [Bacteroidales bacterium]